MTWIFSLCFFVLALPILGNELPKISQHSRLQTTIYQGDSIKLQILPENQVTEIQWWLDKAKICSGESCLFDSRDLDPGIYKIITVVVNDFGSNFINFLVKVKENTKNRAPATIEEDLIENDNSFSEFDSKNPYVVALQGTGFTWRADKLQFIKKKPRNLDWNEKIKSSGGIISFGLKSADEYLMYPGTEVRLLETPTKDKIVVLQSGTIRYRHRNSDSKNLPSLIVGDWLQIDGEIFSDFIVEYSLDAEEIYIYTLSGQTRFIKQSNSKDLSKQEFAVLPAGVQVRIAKKGKLKPIYKGLPLRKMPKLIRSTSPEYLGKEALQNEISERYTGLDYENTIKTAEELIRNRNYSIALEILKFSPESLKKTPHWMLLMGQALGELNLARESLEYLKPSFKILQSSPLAYMIGMQYFKNQNFKKAKSWFEKALELDGNANRHLCLYYLGVIAFEAKDYPVATRYFTETIWYADSLLLIDSSKGFLDLINYYNDWGVDIQVLSRLDSNLFRTSDKKNLSFQNDISGLSGVGYDADLDIWKYLFHTRNSSLKVGYHFQRLGWLRRSLAKLDFIDQSLYTSYTFGRDIKLSGSFALVTKIMGEERSADGLEMDNSIAWNSMFWRPTLLLHLGVYKDPLPGRNDILDPINFELLESANDRSSRVLNSGLEFTVWEAPRQSVVSGISQKSRTFTNKALNGENYVELGLTSNYYLRFWGLSQFTIGAEFRDRTFAESDTKRADSAVTLKTGYRFDMEQDGNFQFNILHESQQSSVERNTYKRIVVSTGIEIHL